MFLVIITAALITAISTLYLAGERRTPFDFIKRLAPIRGLLRLFSCCIMAVVLNALARDGSWETAVPIWLGLVSLTGVGYLFLVAISQRAHLVCGFAAVVITVFGSGIYAFTDLLS